MLRHSCSGSPSALLTETESLAETLATYNAQIGHGLNSPISPKLLFNMKEQSNMVPMKTAVSL